MKRITSYAVCLGAVCSVGLLLGANSVVAQAAPSGAARQLPAAVTLSLQVKDFRTWKAVFDGRVSKRRAAGIQVALVMRERGKVHHVIVHLMGTSKTKLAAYLKSPNLKKEMIAAGVTAKPQVVTSTHMALKPPSSGQAKVTTAVLVRLAVRDFTKWLRVFHSGSAVQRKAGVVAYVIARGPVRKRTDVYAILGGTNAAKLKALVYAKDTARAMKRGTAIAGSAKFLFVDVIDAGAVP